MTDWYHLMSDPTTTLPEGFEPSISRLTVGRLNHLGHGSKVSPTGFEPVLREETDLESVALTTPP